MEGNHSIQLLYTYTILCSRIKQHRMGLMELLLCIEAGQSFVLFHFLTFIFTCSCSRYEDVNCYEEKAPHAREAHPWPDHFYPLHVAMGAAGKDAKAKLIHHSWSFGTLSYASYQFTTAAS